MRTRTLQQNFLTAADECVMLHIMNSREVMKLLEKDGWKLVAVRGSHHQYKHPIKLGRVTVPHPTRDLKIGTLQSILKQAGLKH